MQKAFLLIWGRLFLCLLRFKNLFNLFISLLNYKYKIQHFIYFIIEQQESKTNNLSVYFSIAQRVKLL